MADRSRMEETLRAAYASRQCGDMAGILSCFAPEVKFTVAGASHVTPVAMRVEGADSFRAAIEQMIATFVIADYDIRTILIDGDKAAVQWRATIRSSVTGETLSTEQFDLHEFKDGRIVSFTEFCDTAAAARLMGPQ